MDRVPNHFQNRIRLLQDAVVPKLQIQNALAGYLLSTRFIAAPEITEASIT